MKEITKKDFDAVVIESKKSLANEVVDTISEVVGITPEELQELEKKATMPINLQKTLVSKLAAYTDYMIAKDLRERQQITEHTRHFIELYNSILVNLHKEMYGEKQVNVGAIKVTHSMIMNEVRKFSKVVDAEVKDESKELSQGPQ